MTEVTNAAVKNEEFKKLKTNEEFKKLKTNEVFKKHDQEVKLAKNHTIHKNYKDDNIRIQPYYQPPEPPRVREKGVRIRTLSKEEQMILKSNARLRKLIISDERDLKYFSPQMASISSEDAKRFVRMSDSITQFYENLDDGKEILPDHYAFVLREYQWFVSILDAGRENACLMFTQIGELIGYIDLVMRQDAIDRFTISQADNPNCYSDSSNSFYAKIVPLIDSLRPVYEGQPLNRFNPMKKYVQLQQLVTFLDDLCEERCMISVHSRLKTRVHDIKAFVRDVRERLAPGGFKRTYQPQMSFLFKGDIQKDMHLAIGALEEGNINLKKLSDDAAFGKIGVKLDSLIDVMKGEGLKDNLDVLTEKFSELKTSFMENFVSNDEFTDLTGYCMIGSAAIMYYLKPSNLTLAMVGFTVGFSLVSIPTFRRTEVFLGIAALIGFVTASEINRRNAPQFDVELYFSPQGVNPTTLEDMCTALASFFGIGFQCIFGKNLGLDFVKGLGDFSRVKQTFNDIFSTVLRGLESVVNKYRNSVMLPSVRFLDSNKSSVNVFIDKLKDIFDRQARGVFTYTKEHFLEIETLLMEGVEILKKCGTDRSEGNISRMLMKDMRKLETIHLMFLNSNYDMAGMRAEAFGVMLAGGPKKGKSITVQSLTFAVAAAQFSEQDFKDFTENPDNFVYVRNTENVYWDRLTYRHYFCYWDDFGQAVDVAGTPANEMFEWIRAVNPFPYVVHKAGLEEKGMLTFNGKLVIGNTNVKEFKARSIHEIKALTRRFNIHVAIIPKPEYLLETSGPVDVWNMEFDPAKLPRRMVNGVETTVFDHTCQLFVPIDGKGNTIGDPYDFDELVKKTIAGINQREVWKHGSKVMLKELAERYRKEYAKDPIEDADLAPQGMGPFGKLSVKAFNALAYNEQSELNFGDDKHSSQKLAVEWLTFWHHILTKTPRFFKKLDQLISKLGGDIYAPYAVKLSCLILLEDFPTFEIEDGPDTMVDAISGFTHYMSVGDNFVDIPAGLFDYDKSIKYTPENYDAFFLDFDRLLAQPKISLARRAVLWMEKHKTPLIGLSIVVGGVIAMPFMYHCGKWIVSFFCGEEVFNEPQSGRADGKSKTTSPVKSLNDRIADLKLSPQMGTPLDSNGQSILESVLRTNHYSFHRTRDGKSVQLLGNLTFIYGRIGLMPLHYLKRVSRYIEDKALDPSSTFNFVRHGSGFTFPVRIADFVKQHKDGRLLGNDLVLFQLPEVYPNHRDIRKFFAVDDDIKLLPPCFEISIAGSSGRDCNALGNRSGSQPIMDADKSGKELEKYEIVDTISYRLASQDGDCGALVFVMNPKIPNRKIFGMHVAGSNTNSIGISGIVTQEMLSEYMAQLTIGSSLQVEEDIVGPPTIIVPQMASLGVLRNFTNRNTTSTIVASPLYGTLISGFTKPARLRPFSIEGVVIDPVKLAYAKYGNNKTVIDREILKQCVLSYFEKVIAGNRDTERRLLTVEECLHGVLNDPSSCRVNPASSAGHPMTNKDVLNLKKMYYSSKESEKEEILLKIKFEVERYEKMMDEGIRPNWYYQDNGKDERLKSSKVDAGKMRLFSGSPFIYLILVKRYFGAFIADYTKKRGTNGSTLGVNVYSEEWDLLVRQLAMVDPKLDHLGAGDYAHYDGDHIPEIEYGCLEIIDMWYGHDMKRYQNTRHILFEDCVFSFHILDGNIIEWPSGMPSGNPLTAILNTMHNNILFRYTWVLCKIPIDLFNLCIVLMCNGDDHLYSVYLEISDRFTPALVEEKMALLGMTYTNEFKDGVDYGFRKITEVQFLKRTFRYDASYHRFVAPLELNTVLDIINWTHKGKEKFSTVANNMANVIRELSLHGKDTFMVHVPKLLKSYHSKMVYPILPVCEYEWRDVYSQVLSTEENII